MVDKRSRPPILESWRQHAGMALFCKTIEECWDHDTESRISAACVIERAKEMSHAEVDIDSNPDSGHGSSVDVDHNNGCVEFVVNGNPRVEATEMTPLINTAASPEVTQPESG